MLHHACIVSLEMLEVWGSMFWSPTYTVLCEGLGYRGSGKPVPMDYVDMGTKGPGASLLWTVLCLSPTPSYANKTMGALI